MALGGGNTQYGIADPPSFSLIAPGGGNLTLYAVGFADPAKAASVTSGTLQLFQWNELNTPSPYELFSSIDLNSVTIELNLPVSLSFGQAIQIGNELLTSVSANAQNGPYNVVRGALGSVPSVHSAGDSVLVLDSTAIVVPFAQNFFQNSASANYMHTISLPDVRIVAAEFAVTNSFGQSQATQTSFADISPEDSTLRTLSGGQFSLQVNGYLATQQNAAPPLIIEATHAVRDIRATVSQAAVGYDISVQLFQSGEAYGVPLLISSGTTISNALINGASLSPLMVGDILTIDVTLNLTTSAESTNGPSPGRDLTITIRL